VNGFVLFLGTYERNLMGGYDFLSSLLPVSGSSQVASPEISLEHSL
jgi:hypothetical protein